jgi:hypothetical protein
MSHKANDQIIDRAIDLGIDKLLASFNITDIEEIDAYSRYFANLTFTSDDTFYNLANLKAKIRSDKHGKVVSTWKEIVDPKEIEATITVNKITVRAYFDEISLSVSDEEGTLKGSIRNLTSEELNDLAEAISRINSLNLNK